MTFVFGSWTLGAALLFSAIKNMSLLQLARGESGPGQPGSIVDAAAAKSGGGGVAVPQAGQVGSEGVSLGRGIGIYVNPDGSKVPVCKWIIRELQRAGARPHIESGYRSKADQARVCATGVKPCATPGKSRHQGKKFPNCAIDVRPADVAETDRKLKKARSPLKWAGSKDEVHFSNPHGGTY
jgi:hypothetical protein